MEHLVIKIIADADEYDTTLKIIKKEARASAHAFSKSLLMWRLHLWQKNLNHLSRLTSFQEKSTV